MPMVTRTILLLSIGFLISNGQGGVDGFANPAGFTIGPTNSNNGVYNHGALHYGFCNRNRIAIPSPTSSSRRTAKQTTSTQLGITVVLPLPLAAPRLTGAFLKVAESWAPSVGVLSSTLLYLAPSRAVWTAIRRARNQSDSDGDGPMHGLNPLPIAMMPSVSLSWLVYGLASSDPYLILGNLPGTILSVAYLIGILPLMNYNAAEFPTLPNIPNMPNIPNLPNLPSLTNLTNIGIDNDDEDVVADVAPVNGNQTKPRKSKTLILTQATVLLSTASTLALWALLGLMTAGATNGMYNIGGLEFGMGFSSMLRSGVIVRSLGLYAASLFLILSATPLTTIRTILRTKSSRTILGSLTAAQCVNTGLWTAYGFAVNDYFVWGPNIIGLGLGLMQLALKILYPSKKRRKKVERSLELSSTAQ
eukprot:CAMPEP_0116144074 /NCGR_PEP_ID=MMETSP0329-20121206/15793_1 /TAXON_ID=697910 /ORGANISM="Pseudo-nitzschia arenysensis, Strain B593" /LENGTH=417 /DNA_ID=CAMNT_0003639443 /DNA_START=293 /DNA_END=1546 /DNA_ORIENTATION=+